MDSIIIYKTDDGQANVKLYANDGTVWMTQKSMAALFDCSIDNISLHLKNIYAEHELEEISTVEYFSVVQKEGSRDITRKIKCFSLNAILAVGFRVRSPRGTQFRRWANRTLKEYLQKGFVLDDERLKNPDGRPDYFDELLERIRDIRASEKRFYQKLRDLFALSSDYDKTDTAARTFFAETQNKLIYGVTGQTAADLIMARADAEKPNMALTSWAGGRVRKGDIRTAKNYLSSDELDSLNRIVTVFLESAELRVKMRKDLTLQYWRQTVDRLLADHDISVLHTKGKHSHEQMKAHVESVYKVFEERRKKTEALQADKDDFIELEGQIPMIKRRNENRRS